MAPPPGCHAVRSASIFSLRHNVHAIIHPSRMVMRPHVVVNCAMSADGKISTIERRQVKISGPGDFARVDRLKAGCDGIMVGIGTVLTDDPSLTVKSPELIALRRAEGRPDHPVRIIVDSTARTPSTASVLTKGPGERIIACSNCADPARVAALMPFATVVQAGDRSVDLPTLLGILGERGIARLLVEGGGTLLGSLFREGLVDEYITYIGGLIIGGSDAPTPADGPGFKVIEGFPRLSLLHVERLDDGVFLHWTVRDHGTAPE